MIDGGRGNERQRAGKELPQVLQFMRLLWALVHGLQTTSKRMRATIGTTGPQRLVLRIVGLTPGISAGELADILHRHPSTLTGVLQRLIDQQLLTRVADPTDRRRAVLRLTRRGARINRRSQGTVEHHVRSALARVTQRDRAVAGRVLAQITGSLERATGLPTGRPTVSPGRRRREAAGSHARSARR